MFIKHIFLVYLCFCAVLIVNFAASAETVDKDVIRNGLDTIISINETERKNPWFSKIPALPIIFASSPTLPDGKCKKQATRYLQELYNGTLWAARMFDASVKYPDGIVAGTTRHYGHFDACYNLKVTIPGFDAESEEITSRYCLVDVEYRNGHVSGRDSEHYEIKVDENESVWNVLNERHDWRQIRRDKIQLALCVPSACSSEDVEAALQERLKEIGQKHGISVQTIVKPTYCQAKIERPELTTSAKVFLGTLLLLITIVLLSTYYDDEELKNHGLAMDFFLCFSLKRNMKSLLSVSFDHPGFDTFHFFRLLLMVLVIGCHRCFQEFENPLINPEALKQTFIKPSHAVYHNGPIVIGGFFAIGGSLLAYILLRELYRTSKMNFFGAVMTRFIRLTPTYAVVILFTALIFPYLGDGPLWRDRVITESINCAQNGWINLLYINNYIHPLEQCMMQSWYVSVDFHLYILGLIVVYIVWKLPKILGYILVGIIILAGLILRFCWTYYGNAQPISLYTAHMRTFRDNPHDLVRYYVRTEGRIPSYFVGVFFGIIFYNYNKSPWKISKFWSKVLFAGSWIGAVYIWQDGFRFLNPYDNSSLFSTAVYASIHRAAFCLCVMMIAFLFTVGEGLESYRACLTKPWMQPLSKLSYGVYLVSYSKQLYDVAVVRQPRTMSSVTFISEVILDVLLSLFVALVLSMIIEAPLRKIQQLSKNRKTSQTKNQLNGSTANISKTKKVT